MPVRTIEEHIESDINGTIIHLDASGKLRTEFADSRQYSEVKPFIFATIDRKKLKIEYAESSEDIPQIRIRITAALKELEKPLLAFNAPYVQAVLYHFTGETIAVEGELNRKPVETRLFAIHTLNIPQYDDPFSDQDRLVSIDWVMGSKKHEKFIAHAKACLLKERDILVKRGFRKPEEAKLRR